MSSNETGPKSYTRINIDSPKLCNEVNDVELEAELCKGQSEAPTTSLKSFENTTTDVPGNSTWQYSSGHLPQRLNLAKEVNMWIGSESYSRGDWRLKAVNKLCNVSQRIRLYPENIDSIQMSYKYNYEKGQAENFLPGKAIFSKLSDILDGAAALGLRNEPAERVGVFDTPKVFKDIENLQLGGELKFNFNFGMAGFFDGLEEVVKPIYALAGLLAVDDLGEDKETKKTKWTGVARLPLPTQAQFTVSFLRDAFITAKNQVMNNAPQLGEVFSSPADALKDVLTTASWVQSTYFNAIQNGNKTIFKNKDGKWDLFYFQIGNFVIGPCTVSKVEWGFDMSNLDENGWPISGWVKLGDIEHYAKATKGIVARTLFSGLSLEDK